ncbi:MAG: hypothetical protein HY561_02205 [Gemmatimonadetes bacterium]|nr:hypothetical protein [Gemmatimonadota bacterium]
MKLIPVPASLEERSFDQMVQPLDGGAEERALLDARRVRWVDPYGMLGLLAVGTVAGADRERPLLQLPESPDVLSYLTRMGFFEQAAGIFELHGGAKRTADAPSDVLLEITPIRSHGDVHDVVDRVNERALAILTRQLGYPLQEAFQFSVILSELCQNIVEHADAPGWVATQTYNWARRLGRKVAVIAVMDLGIGFKRSLASMHAARFGDRWSDATALEAALIHGLTRFHDPGRGQGIQQIRKLVGRWGGKLSIRSGTARIADVPSWDDAPPLEQQLPPFPGAQIGIVLPARTQPAAAPAGGAGARSAGGQKDGSSPRRRR